MQKKIKNIILEFFVGDISEQPGYAAVVNAANAELRPGGGVAGAIHQKAGPRLDKECRKHAPIETGEAVITDAYDLPNEKVIHTLGPVYDESRDQKKQLAQCYKNSLELAEENEISSVLFPAISTGAFNYPIQEATETALKTIRSKLNELSEVKEIGFILHNQEDLEVYREKAKEIL
ncbi:MAG: O-acetyl-ADP-ribose deacetylase (regulator of RNase III) containing Macro domain [Candidatus Methanohalarchaeum thermophilum]|uniref:O-acetyl-ADP-ribose deacetylase (Regulator of RNase III) containing Macro domain n=1 Tax=Methanohalarchaeum thermophilum TaxID=1903181 RepID=A0A1Q6DSU9_METT1|nr:MAG: O-acetyl-ADP-ribose deacetylase (regulator of RNase III) containing Macro domain [Candidatus Methanohalarchaeum thermophilum]